MIALGNIFCPTDGVTSRLQCFCLIFQNQNVNSVYSVASLDLINILVVIELKCGWLKKSNNDSLKKFNKHCFLIPVKLTFHARLFSR